MPNITVKDVPAKLHQRLKARALAHRRSLNREIVALTRRPFAGGWPGA